MSLINVSDLICLIYRIVQSFTDLAIAQKLALMLRNGDIGGQKFTKIVGVGHSYGSVQTQALSATLPNVLDAVILQGFTSTSRALVVFVQTITLAISVNATALPFVIAGAAFSIATEVFPERFSKTELTNGYLATLGVSFYQLTL